MTDGGEARRREYRSSGVYALQSKLAMVDEGQDWTDALGPAVAALVREWRCCLLDDLGGEANVGTQQRALVEVCARTYLMVETVDAYILSMGPLVNAATQSLFPVVLERQRLVDRFVHTLAALGLERVPKPAPTLRDMLGVAYGAEGGEE